LPTTRRSHFHFRKSRPRGSKCEGRQKPAGKQELQVVGQLMRNIWIFVIPALVVISAACSQGTRRSGVPAGAQAALDRSLEDIDAGRIQSYVSKAARQTRKRSHTEFAKRARRANFDRAHQGTFSRNRLSNYIRPWRRHGNHNAAGTRWPMVFGEVLCQFKSTEVEGRRLRRIHR
jgi:hypothetical protein